MPHDVLESGIGGELNSIYFQTNTCLAATSLVELMDAQCSFMDIVMPQKRPLLQSFTSGSQWYGPCITRDVQDSRGSSQEDDHSSSRALWSTLAVSDPLLCQ